MALLGAEARALELDVLCLQEVLELESPMKEGTKLASQLDELGLEGMHRAFGLGHLMDGPWSARGHALRFGNAVLSRWPITTRHVEALPGADASDQQRSLLHAVVARPAGPVDVFAVGMPVTGFDNLPYPSSTPFVDVPIAGMLNIDIAPAGEGVANAVVSLPGFNFEAGEAYTFVAWGELAEGTLPAFVVTEEFEGLPDGFVRIRTAHAAAGVGQVDVYAAFISPMPALATDLDEGTTQTLDIPSSSLAAAGDPIAIIIDADGDMMADFTFDLAASAIEGVTFATVYAVATETGPVLFLLSRGDSTRVGPLMPNVME